MGAPLLEVNQKPAVFLCVIGPVPETAITALENGLEEEGIPCEHSRAGSDNAVRAASQAAKASRINVGICVSAKRADQMTAAVLHHRDLPETRPLFRLSPGEFTTMALCRLGRNAARLVKGNPFILDEDGPAPSTDNKPGPLALKDKVNHDSD